MDDRLAGVRLTDEMREAIKVKAAVAAATPEKKKPIRFKRGLLTAVAACLAVVFSLSVAAAVFPDFEHFLRRMGEDLRGKVQPVEVSATDEGIRMDVLAAVHDGESAILYLGLTDETGKERIDKHTELAWVSTNNDMPGWGPLVDFDSESGTAIFRVEVSSYGEPLEKDMTLTLRAIDTGVVPFERVDTGLTLASITAANPTPQLAAQGDFESGLGHGVSWGDDPDDPLPNQISAMVDAGTMPLLARDSAPMQLDGPDWLEVGAAGVVDGMLHVQYGPATDEAIYNRAMLYLDWDDRADAYGYNGLVNADINLEVYPGDDPRERYTLTESVYALPEGVPAQQVRLMVSGIEVAEHLTGEWAVSFKLDDHTPELVAHDVESGILIFQNITVSTIGVKANYRYKPGAMPPRPEGAEPDEILLPDDYGQAVDFKVFLKDGTEVNAESFGAGGDNEGNMSADASFSRPIDINEVDRLLLNGEEVALTPRR